MTRSTEARGRRVPRAHRIIGIAIACIAVAIGVCYGTAIVNAAARVIEAATLGRSPLQPILEIATHYIIGSVIGVGGFLAGSAIATWDVERSNEITTTGDRNV